MIFVDGEAIWRTRVGLNGRLLVNEEFIWPTAFPVTQF